MTTRFKIAIATSNGKDVDLHFGKAGELAIYEFDGEGFHQVETRPIPRQQAAEESDDCSPFSCGGCGGGAGGGCCGGGGAASPAVEALLDCHAVIAARIGGNVTRQFERKGISVFDVDYPVKQVLDKLAAYYKKIC
ncbi:MAG: hypothetical protein IJU95_00990 [Treponema sp.]|nr:hypothetical protein [Treponema sp.]